MSNEVGRIFSWAQHSIKIRKETNYMSYYRYINKWLLWPGHVSLMTEQWMRSPFLMKLRKHMLPFWFVSNNCSTLHHYHYQYIWCSLALIHATEPHQELLPISLHNHGKQKSAYIELQVCTVYIVY